MKQTVRIRNIQGNSNAFEDSGLITIPWESVKNALSLPKVRIPAIKLPFARIFNRYVLIMGIIFVLSLLQLNLLGRGIFSTFNEDTQAPAVVTEEKAKEFVPTRIQIEKANIDLPVVSVPLKNGTWEVYPKTANFAQGTSIVSEKGGNVGIFGHDRADAFANIKQLQSKDSYVIILSSKSYRAIYEVDKTSIVEPTAVNVFDQTKEPTLTLITCEGVFSEKRFMVKAKLIKIEEINK
jgi:LPXTG-site transpeptidase (sortase) family protein